MSNKRILLSTSKLAKTSPYREVHFSMKIIVYESFFYLLKKNKISLKWKKKFIQNNELWISVQVFFTVKSVQYFLMMFLLVIGTQRF